MMSLPQTMADGGRPDEKLPGQFLGFPDVVRARNDTVIGNREAGLPSRRERAFDPVARPVVRFRRRKNEGDVAMAEPGEMAGHDRAGLEIVRTDAGHFRVRAVIPDRHDRDIPLRQHVHGNVLMIETDQHHPVDAPLEERAHDRGLKGQIVTVGGDQHGPVVLHEARGKGLDHFGEDRIVDGRDDQAERAGESVVKGARETVADIAEIPRRGFDPHPGRATDNVGRVVEARYGGGRNAGPLCHFDNARRTFSRTRPLHLSTSRGSDVPSASEAHREAK